MQVEVRGIPPVLKSDWDQKLRAYDEKLAKLAQDIEWAEKTNSERNAAPKKSFFVLCRR
jgi:hypothetical protein